METYLPIAELLSKAGIDAVIHVVTPSKIGGNNQIYHVETSKGVFSAKRYFRHEDDHRDRLSAEYDLLQYASQVTPSFVPRPYACNHEAGWALYESLEGTHINPGHVEWRHVKQAVAFFQGLNKSVSRKALRRLPLASEAVFSVADHLAIVAGRINCLHEALSNAKDSDPAGIHFIEELQYFWKLLSGHTEEAAAEAGWFKKPLDKEQYCISPSDFGFHNALIKDNGDIQFIDFEYAGFDDPAKMAGDFLRNLRYQCRLNFITGLCNLPCNLFPIHIT